MGHAQRASVRSLEDTRTVLSCSRLAQTKNARLSRPQRQIKLWICPAVALRVAATCVIKAMRFIGGRFLVAAARRTIRISQRRMEHCRDDRRLQRWQLADHFGCGLFDGSARLDRILWRFSPRCGISHREIFFSDLLPRSLTELLRDTNQVHKPSARKIATAAN